MSSPLAQTAAIQHEAVPMLDLKRQYASIADEVKAALERVLTTQHFIGGAEVEEFERESAEYLGVRASVGCASGTDALWLALLAAGVGPETSVVTTPFSFFASVSSIVRCGATPVLADIDPATLNLDPGAGRECAEAGTFAPGARGHASPSLRTVREHGRVRWDGPGA